jgi:CheY-like chemotaxis protein
MTDSDPRLDVLVVDDNPLNRALVEAILEKLGLQTTSAESGAEAIELTAVRSFDLIIMDGRMPGLDGDETTRRIRARGQSRGALIVRWTTEDAGRLNAALYDGDLPKPLTCSPLVAAVSLASRRARNRADHAGGGSWAEGGEHFWTH